MIRLVIMTEKEETESFTKELGREIAGEAKSVVRLVAVGSLITGNGVGREVYVREVNVGASEITLSQPLYAPNSTQTYTFTRFKYVLDF